MSCQPMRRVWRGVLLTSVAMIASGLGPGISAARAGAIRYSVTHLGTLPGYEENFRYVPRGINASGQVLGDGYLYSDGQMQPLPAGDYFLNDSGVVLASRPPGEESSSRPMGVNNLGQTVGLCYAHGYTGYVVTDGVVTYLGPQTEGLAINDLGQVTGFSSQARPFIYSDGVFTDIPLLPHATMAAGVAINNRGEVVGGMHMGGRSNGFLYSDGVLYDLGTLGGKLSTPTDINNLGVVVGAADALDGMAHAFVYERGRMFDLNSLIDFDADLLLTVAKAINDAGQIAAYGTYKGERRGFLLTPIAVPEPSTLVVLGTAVIALLGRRAIRRRR